MAVFKLFRNVVKSLSSQIERDTTAAEFTDNAKAIEDLDIQDSIVAKNLNRERYKNEGREDGKNKLSILESGIKSIEFDFEAIKTEFKTYKANAEKSIAAYDKDLKRLENRYTDLIDRFENSDDTGSREHFLKLKAKYQEILDARIIQSVEQKELVVNENSYEKFNEQINAKLLTYVEFYEQEIKAIDDFRLQVLKNATNFIKDNMPNNQGESHEEYLNSLNSLRKDVYQELGVIRRKIGLPTIFEDAIIIDIPEELTEEEQPKEDESSYEAPESNLPRSPKETAQFNLKELEEKFSFFTRIFTDSFTLYNNLLDLSSDSNNKINQFINSRKAGISKYLQELQNDYEIIQLKQKTTDVLNNGTSKNTVPFYLIIAFVIMVIIIFGELSVIANTTRIVLGLGIEAEGLMEFFNWCFIFGYPLAISMAFKILYKAYMDIKPLKELEFSLSKPGNQEEEQLELSLRQVERKIDAKQVEINMGIGLVLIAILSIAFIEPTNLFNLLENIDIDVETNTTQFMLFQLLDRSRPLFFLLFLVMISMLFAGVGGILFVEFFKDLKAFIKESHSIWDLFVPKILRGWITRFNLRSRIKKLDKIIEIEEDKIDKVKSKILVIEREINKKISLQNLNVDEFIDNLKQAAIEAYRTGYLIGKAEMLENGGETVALMEFLKKNKIYKKHL